MLSRRVTVALMSMLLGLTLAMAGCAPQAEEPEPREPAEETQTQEPTVTLKATISVSDQQGASDRITVDRVVAPQGGWLVVHLDDNGKPGKRIGLQQLPAGETSSVQVTIDPGGSRLTDRLIVAVHTDTGQIGTFEFDPEKFDQAMEAAPEGQEPSLEGITDPPYFVGGKEAATMFRVR